MPNVGIGESKNNALEINYLYAYLRKRKEDWLRIDQARLLVRLLAQGCVRRSANLRVFS